jgi:hypothetical protein
LLGADLLSGPTNGLGFHPFIEAFPTRRWQGLNHPVLLPA